MNKSLSEIVGELYEPEPKGEKRFVAKHKKELVEPAKKLDDKIFKPSTKKADYKEAPKVYEGKTEKKDKPVDDKEAREKLRQRRLAFVNENSVEYYDALDKERKAKWHYSRAGKNKNASLSKGIEHDYKSQLLKRGVIDAEGKQKSLRAEEVEMLDEGVSRKHFQAVAATIKAISDPEKRQEHADMHAETFAHLNKRFDHAKFHAACGTKTKDQRALRSANVNTPGVHVGNNWYPKGHSKYNELRAEETDVSEGLRLIATHTEGPHTAKVYRDKEWNEHRVKFYHNGEYQKNADYHTDDKQDAHDTAKAQLKRYMKESMNEAKMTKAQKDAAYNRFWSHDPETGARIKAFGKKERDENKSFKSAKKEIDQLKKDGK